MIRPARAILDYRPRRTDGTNHPPEVGQVLQVLRYAVLLAACWFLLSGGVVYVVIAIFNYVNGGASLTMREMTVSLAVLAMTCLVGMSLYLLRPRT